MLPKVIGNYGGPYADAFAVQNPTTQMAASKANRLMEDAAQLTRANYTAIVTFPTNATTNPTVSAHTSVWGSSNAQKPTVTRSAAGKYLVTYAASFDDALGTTETLAFVFAHVSLGTGAAGATAFINAITSNTVEVWTYDNTNALSDLGGAINVTVWIR